MTIQEPDCTLEIHPDPRDLLESADQSVRPAEDFINPREEVQIDNGGEILEIRRQTPEEIQADTSGVYAMFGQPTAEAQQATSTIHMVFCAARCLKYSVASTKDHKRLEFIRRWQRCSDILQSFVIYKLAGILFGEVVDIPILTNRFRELSEPDDRRLIQFKKDGTYTGNPERINLARKLMDEILRISSTRIQGAQPSDKPSEYINQTFSQITQEINSTQWRIMQEINLQIFCALSIFRSRFISKSFLGGHLEWRPYKFMMDKTDFIRGRDGQPPRRTGIWKYYLATLRPHAIGEEEQRPQLPVAVVEPGTSGSSRKRIANKDENDILHKILKRIDLLHDEMTLIRVTSASWQLAMEEKLKNQQIAQQEICGDVLEQLGQTKQQLANLTTSITDINVAEQEKEHWWIFL